MEKHLYLLLWINPDFFPGEINEDFPYPIKTLLKAPNGPGFLEEISGLSLSLWRGNCGWLKLCHCDIKELA